MELFPELVKDRKIYYHKGVMDSGKSADLLIRAYNYEEKGHGVVVAKPKVDDKGDDWIVSRVGNGEMKRQADTLVAPEDDIVIKLREIIVAKSARCVFIDEVQFLEPEQISDLRKGIALGMKTPIMVYGLVRDFRRELFPGSAALLTEPDVVQRELRSICYCGYNKATVNVRREGGEYVFEGPQVAIEKGERKYETYCDPCFERTYEAIQNGEIPNDAPAGVMCKFDNNAWEVNGRSAIPQVPTTPLI